MQHPQCIWLRNCWWMYSAVVVQGEKSLKNEEHSGRQFKFGNVQLRGLSKLILWQLRKICSRTPCQPFYGHSVFEKVKKFDKWLPHVCKLKKKIIILKCHLLLFYATTTKQLLTRLRCAMKCGFCMTTGNEQLSGWTKKKL